MMLLLFPAASNILVSIIVGSLSSLSFLLLVCGAVVCSCYIHEKNKRQEDSTANLSSLGSANELSNQTCVKELILMENMSGLYEQIPSQNACTGGKQASAGSTEDIVYEVIPNLMPVPCIPAGGNKSSAMSPNNMQQEPASSIIPNHHYNTLEELKMSITPSLECTGEPTIKSPKDTSPIN